MGWGKGQTTVLSRGVERVYLCLAKAACAFEGLRSVPHTLPSRRTEKNDLGSCIRIRREKAQKVQILGWGRGPGRWPQREAMFPMLPVSAGGVQQGEGSGKRGGPKTPLAHSQPLPRDFLLNVQENPYLNPSNMAGL